MVTVMDVFWGITLALWANVFIPVLILRLSDWVKDKRAIRKDRQRINQLMAATEAQREQYRTPTNP